MLQYASLKAVLQYLDANIRFEIYNRCPSIRKTERAVPLYINSLEFIPGVNSPNEVVVNSTTYSIGTIRVYPSGAYIQKEHKVANMKGGVGSDLDRFGIEDYTSDSHLTPGDIPVGRPRRARRFAVNQLENLIRWFEAVDMLLALKRGGNPVISDRQHPHYFISQQFKDQSITAIRKHVENVKNIVLPHLNRRNNISVPYTTQVQMTINSRESKKVHRYPGRKLYQVEKKLLTLFFGGRKHIYVKSLETYGAKVFRFPVEMIIKIQHLCMTSNKLKGLDAISQLVHPTSFPLETIKFRHLRNNEIPHAIVKSAKKLIILGVCENRTRFLKVATQNVVEVKRPEFTPEDYLVLARNWLETSRTVGTCCVFDFEEASVVAKVMRLLKYELNAEAVGAQCLKVRIDETSKLKIAYQRGQTTWRMQFKVISE